MPEAISDQPTMCASLTTLRLTFILHLAAHEDLARLSGANNARSTHVSVWLLAIKNKW